VRSWEPIDEESPLALPEKDDGPVSAGLPLSRPRDPLFDDAAAEVGVDPAPFRPRHGGSRKAASEIPSLWANR
jgi:hypothetical protein